MSRGVAFMRMLAGFAVLFMRRIGFNVLAECCYMQRIFVRGVGFRFSNGLRRTYDFLNVVFVLAVVFVLVVMFLVVFFVAKPSGGFLRAFILFVELLLVFFVLLDFRGRPLVNGLFLFVVFFGFVLFKNRRARS
jgi:hypothetical protein